MLDQKNRCFLDARPKNRCFLDIQPKNDIWLLKSAYNMLFRIFSSRKKTIILKMRL